MLGMGKFSFYPKVVPWINVSLSVRRRCRWPDKEWCCSWFGDPLLLLSTSLSLSFSPSADLVGLALLSPYSLHRAIMGFQVQYVLRLLSFLKIQTLEFAFRWMKLHRPCVRGHKYTPRVKKDRTIKTWSSITTHAHHQDRCTHFTLVNLFRENAYGALVSSIQRYIDACALAWTYLCSIR